MRLKNFSKRIFSNNLISNRNLKLKSYKIDKTFYDNSFKSMAFIFKKIDDSENKSYKRQLYFYYLSTFIDRINNENRNVIFNEIGEIIKLSFPCLEIIQKISKLSEANTTNEENEINRELIIKKLNSFAILEYFIMKNNNISRNSIRKILNGYENIPDFLMQTIKLKSRETTHLKTKEELFRTDYEKSKLKLNEEFKLNNLNYEYKELRNKTNDEILTIKEVVELKQNISENISENQNDYYSISENQMEDKLLLLNNLFERCSDKNEINYLTKYILGEGYSFYFLLETLKKINNSYSKEITDEFFHYLEKNVLKFSIDFKIKNNIYNYIFKNEQINLELGFPFDFCFYKPGINLKDLLYNYGNFTKDLLMEIKFKGKRSQIHFNKKKVNIFIDDICIKNKDLIRKFSLKLENDVNLYNENNPATKIDNFILDGDFICYSNETKKIFDLKNIDENLKSNLDEVEEKYNNFNYNSFKSGKILEEKFNQNLNDFKDNSNIINKNLDLELNCIMNDDYIIYESNRDINDNSTNSINYEKNYFECNLLDNRSKSILKL